MKKVATILIVAIMVISLCGCSQKSEIKKAENYIMDNLPNNYTAQISVVEDDGGYNWGEGNHGYIFVVVLISNYNKEARTTVRYITFNRKGEIIS